MKLELVAIPVTEVDRAKAFYVEKSLMTARPYALVLAIVLAGCVGSTVSETFGEVGEAVPAPMSSSPAASSTDSEAPTATFVVVGGGAVGGPGVSISDALANAGGEAALVNGILLMDREGVIWLCEELLESSPPQCAEPRLLVENFPEGTADFDLDRASDTGLQDADGVRWLEGAQLYGQVVP